MRAKFGVKEISLGELYATIMLFTRQVFLENQVVVNGICLDEKTKFDPKRASYILTIMQEAIDNAQKHSSCTEFCFVLEEGALKIGDNGKGFNSALSYTGNGISIMELNARNLNASFLLTSEPNVGTKIEIIFAHAVLPLVRKQ